jgi:hypothetical protein
MNRVMLYGLSNELAKIAVSMAQPAPIPAPPRTTFKDVTKPQTSQRQNYTNVNTETPMAAVDTASGTKTVPPPPVQT